VLDAVFWRFAGVFGGRGGEGNVKSISILSSMVLGAFLFFTEEGGKFLFGVAILKGLVIGGWIRKQSGVAKR